MVASCLSSMKTVLAFAFLFPLVCGTCLVSAEEAEEKEPEARKEEATEATEAAWRSLFDGKTLKGWEVIEYAGQGGVSVKEGAIHIGQGEMLSGVRCAAKDLPKVDYEIELEARRLQGNDFFCCLTFPYRD